MMNGLVSTSNTYQDFDAASSDSELPVRGKLSFKERSAAVGREAALQKQLQEAVKDRQDLVKRYEHKDQKCNELRDKLKVTKAALASRDRELELAQRMLQKLGQEKSQLRDENAEHKVYVRKLEARLDELKNAADISSKYQAAKQKATELQHQLVSAAAELGASKDLAAARQKEIDRLNRALDVRASELSQEAGGQDIPAKLLYSLAESREESLELAKQLAATKADMHKLKQSAARLTSRVESAELMRADAEVAAEQLKQRLEKLLGSSQEVTKSRANMAQLLVTARGEAEAYKSERDELAEVVLEMQEEIEQLKAAADAAKANAEFAASAAADEAMHQVANTHAAAQDARQQQLAREAQLSQKCTQLTEQASQLEAALQQQLQSAQQTAAARHQQIMVLESQLTSRRQRELELERQVAELQSRAEQLGGAVSSAEAAASRMTQLEQQVVRLEASLRVASVERQQLEQRLKQAGDDAAALQQEMQRELDGLRVQLAAKEAAHRCTLEDVAALQKQLDDVVNQLDKTANAKAELQHNMLSQITSIKEKLQIAEQQSQQQLLAPGSPIFPARHRSSSTKRRSLPYKSSNRASLSVDDYDDAIGPAAAVALAVAKAWAKHASLAAKRGSRATSPNVSAGTGRAVGRPRSQSLAVRSSGSACSRAASARQLQLQHTAGGSNDVAAAAAAASRVSGEHLAAAAAARVANFAANLQQSDAISGSMHPPSPQAASGSNSVRLGVLGRAGSSAAMRPAPEVAASVGHATLLRRSLDNGTLLRPGSIYGSDDEDSAQILQQTLHQLSGSPHKSPGAAGQLTSPHAGQGAHVSTVGYGAAAMQQQQQRSSAGLADQIDGMSWLDILKADSNAMGPERLSASPQRPLSQVAAVYDDSVCDGQHEQYSPHRSTQHYSAARNAGAAAAHSSGSHSQLGGGRGMSKSIAHQRQDSMYDTTHVAPRYSASPDAVSDSRTAHAVRSSLADYHAHSQPAEALDSRPHSAAAAAAPASPTNLSWLQQPMEPYSPTVAASTPAGPNKGSSGHSLQSAVQQPTAAGAGAAGRSRGDELADPYSLPGSTEQSAVSLHGTAGGMQGTFAGAGPVGGVDGIAGRSRGGAWQPTQQQQQQVVKQQNHSADGLGDGPTKKAVASGAAANRRPAGGARRSDAAAAEDDSRVSELLHACGAWEVTFDSDSNTDDHQDRHDGCSSKNSNSSSADNQQAHRSGQREGGRHPQKQQQQLQAAVDLKRQSEARQPTSPRSAAAHGSFADSPSQQQQQQVRFTDAAAPLSHQQSKLEATRAALRQLSSKRQSASAGASALQSPRLQTQAAGSSSQQSQQSRGIWVTQAAATRASLDLQQQKQQQNTLARVGSASHDRRVSDGSSSGSNGQAGTSAAQYGRAQSLGHGFQGRTVTAGAHRGAAAALLSPPSTGKVDGVMARRSGMRPLPMQDLEGDATCQLQTSSSRLNAASQQQRHMQQQQQHQQQHDSSLEQSVSRKWPGSCAAAGGGHEGHSRSMRQADSRGGGQTATMDALIAKLSEGEPTLQDLADLESML